MNLPNDRAQTRNRNPRDVVPLTFVAPAPFNYDRLTTAVAQDLRDRAARIRQSIANTMPVIIAIGNELLAAKEKLDHGQFSDWVQDEVGIQTRTAQNYMNAARFAAAHKSEIVSHLHPAAVYQLAAPSTPPRVVNAVLDRVEAGEVVSDAAVVEMVKNGRRQQRRIDRDAEPGRRRIKEEQQAQKQREREAAHRAACLDLARSIHQRLGSEASTWLREVLSRDPYDILDALGQVVDGGRNVGSERARIAAVSLVSAGRDREPSLNGISETSNLAVLAPVSDASEVSLVPGDEAERCAQCRGAIDGTERQFLIKGEQVWLHPECQPFWAEGDGWGVRR
jgi:Protein of unknown function (DUF3102)